MQKFFFWPGVEWETVCANNGNWPAHLRILIMLLARIPASIELIFLRVEHVFVKNTNIVNWTEVIYLKRFQKFILLTLFFCTNIIKISNTNYFSCAKKIPYFKYDIYVNNAISCFNLSTSMLDEDSTNKLPFECTDNAKSVIM